MLSPPFYAALSAISFPPGWPRAGRERSGAPLAVGNPAPHRAPVKLAVLLETPLPVCQSSPVLAA